MFELTKSKKKKNMISAGKAIIYEGSKCLCKYSNVINTHTHIYCVIL